MALGRLIFLALVSCILAEDPKIHFVEKFEGEFRSCHWNKLWNFVDFNSSIDSWSGSLLSEILLFPDQSYQDRWVESTHKGSDAGKFVWTAGKFYNDADLDKGKFTSVVLAL